MRSVKRHVRAAVCRAALIGGWVAARRRRARGRALVLTYHRVLPAGSPRIAESEAGMVVSEATFRMQMEHLRLNYHVLSLDGFIDSLRYGFAEDRPSCLVTFDDGWADNVAYALPVLRELGIPAVVFLATDYVGTDRTFWSDLAARIFSRLFARLRAGDTAPASGELARLADLLRPERARAASRDVWLGAAVERLKAMPEEERERALAAAEAWLGEHVRGERQIVTWAEVKTLAGAGVAVGAHTLSHPILTEIPQERRRREIFEPRRVIAEQTGVAPRAFCYPNGNHDDGIVALVREAGYEVAFTVRRGTVGRGDDPWRLPRLGLHEDISRTEPLFACWITETLP